MHQWISITGVGAFLELAVNAEIGKEADVSERRRGVIRGSFPAFSVMYWIKQRNTLLADVKYAVVMKIHTEHNKHRNTTSTGHN